MTRVLLAVSTIAVAVGLTAAPSAARSSTATGTTTVSADATIAAGHDAASTEAHAVCAKSKKTKRARIVVGAGNVSVIYEVKCSDVATTATAPTTTAAPTAPSGPIFTQSGTGTATTSSFKVPSTWDLAWSFDCSQNVINTGLFSVSIYDDYGQDSTLDFDNQGVNQSGAGTNGVEHYHSGGNTKFLKIIATCPWTVTVAKP